MRHFAYDSPSSDDNYIQLEKDKVIYHRSKSKQVTTFTKSNSSLKSMPSDRWKRNSLRMPLSDPCSRIQRRNFSKKRRVRFSHRSMFEDEFQMDKETPERKICSENV